ncbi:MAG: hypothetical protein RH917_01080 [Lacipirellulaceae bacterium]
MHRITVAVVAGLSILVLTVDNSLAQPERRGGFERSSGDADVAGREVQGRRGGPGSFRDRGRPQNLLFEAIDLNNDGEISAVELRKAAAALKKLDADKDGKITLAEATPPRGPGSPGEEGPGGERRGGGPEAFVARLMENDANGDKKLTPNEVPEQLMPMLQGGDTNGDKAIDEEELLAIAEAQGGRRGRGFRGGPGGERGGPQMVEQMMQRTDANGDGQLTPDEVPERMRQMLQGKDTNGDGAISAEELSAAMQDMRGRRRGPGGERGAGGRERPEGRARGE